MPPAPPPPFLIWQVWWYDQQTSRASTDPIQPSDPSKPRRMYVIVATPRDGWDKLTCCPIQDVGRGVGLTEVELLQGSYPFIIKNSKVLCHEIYTLPKIFFRDYKGQLDQAHREKIKMALGVYLRIP